MSVIAYPNKRWRHDADMHRLIGSGGGAVPAVIAAAGASTDPKHKGEFWWRVGDRLGYEPSLSQAKDMAEAAATEREKAP